jgi:hypothetical protein
MVFSCLKFGKLACFGVKKYKKTETHNPHQYYEHLSELKLQR